MWRRGRCVHSFCSNATPQGHFKIEAGRASWLRGTLEISVVGTAIEKLLSWESEIWKYQAYFGVRYYGGIRTLP